MGRTMTPAEKYLNRFNKIFGKEAEIIIHPSLENGLPGVSTLIYKNSPIKGMTVGISYGLSLTEQSQQIGNRSEICICVESDNVNWANIVGYIAAKQRSSEAFKNGQVFNFGKPIQPDSDMSAFILSVPCILRTEDFENIDIGLNYNINILELYPLYNDDLAVYSEIGLDRLKAQIDINPYSLIREKLKLT